MRNGHIQGGCLCGKVRYRTQGPVTNAALCHCRTCRKAAAAPVVAWITVAAANFSFSAGTPAEYRSSEAVVRTFCRDCGTPLTYTHRDFPAGVDVTVCSLDDPEAFAPRDHIWTEHRLAWLEINDNLPAHRRTRPQP
jgi:hypothetical protein